ncbi:MAG: 50S ribosomal protein L9 [Deltaproteobacteria bacterium]|nr:50S ribosomal protein L9 [Deltaproteobacteria bacterium]
MNVILTTNVRHLGSLGDEVRVKDGYGRNFLIPRGLAILSDTRNAKAIAHQRKQLEAKRALAVQEANALAEKVKALELVIHAKAGPTGKLYAAVTNRQLQEVLEGLGVSLERKAISFLSSVKGVGNYAAALKLHSDVKIEVNVKVVAVKVKGEEAPAEEAPAESEEAAAEQPAQATQA